LLILYIASYVVLAVICVYVTDFEIARQIDILNAFGEVINETRAFNMDTGYGL